MPKASSSATDLSQLTQSQVSWLIGKPTSWLRENSQLFCRDSKARYDGREVFSTMAKLLGSVVITQPNLEKLHEYAKNPANCEECFSGLSCDFHVAGRLELLGDLVSSYQITGCHDTSRGS